jgi:hypothetical protein
MKYPEEAKHLWQTLVPESGQADTIPGEHNPDLSR